MANKQQRERDEIKWMIAREIPALRRYATLLVRNRDGGDDLVQDTLERAMNKSHTWRREGSIRSWLYRIQYSVFLNRYRKAHVREIADSDAVEQAAGIAPGGQENTLEYKRLMVAIEKLKPRQRDVLMLVAAQGFSYDQAAAIMDVPVGTVRSRLARARSDLRALMKETGNAETHALSPADTGAPQIHVGTAAREERKS